MINTLNETHLHRTVKQLYALNEEGSRTEEKVGDYIADIVTPQGNIIEIQTGSLGHLLPKLRYFISEKRKVTVVYPLAATKYIETRNPRTGKSTRRKSPRHQNIYSMFRELTALAPLLCNSRFTLEVLECTVTEERRATETPVQSQNARRRFCKAWLKEGKRLDEIGPRHCFHARKAYFGLLPAGLAEPFSAQELYAALKAQGKSLTQDNARLMIWVFVRAGLLECCGKRGRSKIYTKKNK